MSNFKVGQRVVAIRDHSQGIIKKDETFPVLGINRNICCGSLTIDVGLKVVGRKRICVCGCSRKNDNYFGASLFRPIDEISNTTYEEVMQWIESGKPIETLN